jgi:hypothetical protein
MTRTSLRLTATIGVAVIAAVASTNAQARRATSEWMPVQKSALHVTEGSISSAGRRSMLQTDDPAMRAEVIDGGQHATSARLWQRYLGESTTTVPLGSGAIRRQIGLKIASADPCNLIYVMWHAYPTRNVQVQVKRNPGQTTSAQCGNNGYTTLANFSLGAGDGTSDHSAHQLEVQMRRDTSGAIGLTILADGETLGDVALTAAQSAGLDGPIGVRSDNGDYLFRLYSNS